MKDQESESGKEFAFAEYHEAANAYFKGVDIGYTTVNHYVAANGFFVALLGVLAGLKSGALAGANEMVKLVPFFALAISGALVFALPHYFRHLENCRKRCEAIEHMYGGKLFTSLGKIAHRKPAFHTGYGLIAIIGLIVALWIYLAVEMQSPGFSFGSP